MDLSSIQILCLIERHGRDVFDRLKDRLNARETHYLIAKDLQIDPGQFSRLVHQCFDNPYILKSEVLEVLQVLARIDAERATVNERERHRLLDATTPLGKVALRPR
jgi:hypothetical protein